MHERVSHSLLQQVGTPYVVKKLLDDKEQGQAMVTWELRERLLMAQQATEAARLSDAGRVAMEERDAYFPAMCLPPGLQFSPGPYHQYLPLYQMAMAQHARLAGMGGDVTSQDDVGASGNDVIQSGGDLTQRRAQEKDTLVHSLKMNTSYDSESEVQASGDDEDSGSSIARNDVCSPQKQDDQNDSAVDFTDHSIVNILGGSVVKSAEEHGELTKDKNTREAAGILAH